METSTQASLIAIADMFESYGSAFSLQADAALEFDGFSGIDVGAAPDFKAPITTVPLNSASTWLNAFANDTVRPVITAPGPALDGIRSSIVSQLGDLKAQFKATQNDTLSELEKIRVLEQGVLVLTDRSELIKKASEAMMAEDSEAAADMLNTARSSAETAIEVYEAAMSESPADPEATPQTHYQNIKRYLELHAAYAKLGGNKNPDATLLQSTFDSWIENFLADFGLGTNGLPSYELDPAVFVATSGHDIWYASRVIFGLTGTTALLGLEGYSAGVRSVSLNTMMTAFDKFYTKWETHVEANEVESAVIEANNLARILIEDRLSGGGLTSWEGFDSERLDFYDRTMLLIVDGNSDPSAVIQSGLRDNIYLAGQRYSNLLFDETNQRYQKYLESLEASAQSDAAEAIQFSGEEYTFFDQLHAVHTALSETDQLTGSTFETIFEGSVVEYTEMLRDSLAATQGDQTVLKENLEDMHRSLNRMIGAIAFLEKHFGEDESNETLIADLKTDWNDLHLEWVGIAQTKKAFWYLSKYTKALATASARYGDAVNAGYQQAFNVAAAGSLQALDQIAAGFDESLSSLRAESFTLHLPGDASIDRFYGRLRFNVEEEWWRVDLGGRVSFPDVGAQFTVINANLASNLDFGLNLYTNGPVSFGPAESNVSLDVTSAFLLAGNLGAGIEAASFSGTLTEDETGHYYAAEVSYNYTEPESTDLPGTHNFHISTGSDVPQQLFTEDLVIFEGGSGLSLSGSDEALSEVALETGVLVGIMRKPEAEGKDLNLVSPEDFYLLFRGQVAVANNPESFSLTLGAGTLAFNESFETRGSAIGSETRPSVSIPAAQPLEFVYYKEDHTNSDLRGTLHLQGSVAFTNLRFGLGDLNFCYAELESLTLVFGYDSATRKPTALMKDLVGELRVPLEADPQGDALGLKISAGDWGLNRMPTDGTISLSENLNLVDLGRLKLSLKGSEDPDQASSLSIQLIDDDTGVWVPRFDLAGVFILELVDTFLRRTNPVMKQQRSQLS